jgi:DNA polymerase III subunit epsilon
MKLKTAAPTEEQKREIKDNMTRWAAERLADPRTLIVDVETTGILSKDPETEICQLSMINGEGRPVLSMLVQPNRPIPLEATKIHGIDQRMVAHCPPFQVVADLVAGLMQGRHIVAYNAAFDVHLLTHMLTKYGFEVPDFETSCAMEAYSAWCGEWMSNKADWKWQKLPKLAYGSAHDSLVDCASTLLLLKKMAGDFSDEPAPEDIDLDF